MPGASGPPAGGPAGGTSPRGCSLGAELGDPRSLPRGRRAPRLAHDAARGQGAGGGDVEPGPLQSPCDPGVARVEQVIAAPRGVEPARAVEAVPETNGTTITVALVFVVKELRHRIEAVA